MTGRPNILFLFSDQHRGDWMPYDADIRRQQGVSELALNMPVIRGLMDRGTSFSCAISPAPVCAPARACLASGMRYKNCRVYWNNANYDPALPNFYGMLKASGYYVCGTGKFDLNKADLEWEDGYHKLLREMGFDAATDSEGKMDTIWAANLNHPGPYGKMLQEAGWLEAHKDDMLNRAHSDKPSPLPDELYADNWVAEKSIEMLKAAPTDRPWFMQVNFSGPHDPWDITASMKEAVKDRVFPQAADCDLANNQGVRQNYAAMIENIDRLCGHIIEAVRARGELDNTVIVYSSDHGEMMGDHNLYGKSKPGQGSVHIPMVIDASCLGGKQGKNVSAPVELEDLAATFLDYAGAAIPDSMEAVSLKPVVSGDAEKTRDYAISELITPNPKGCIRSFGAVTDGRYKFIMRSSGEEQLYDLQEDPFECSNILSEKPEEADRLRKAFGMRKRKAIPGMEIYAKAFAVQGDGK